MGAEWVFDQYRAAQMAVMLGDSPQEVRELAYVKARVASEMQGSLMSICETFETDQEMRKRKEEREAQRNVRSTR